MKLKTVLFIFICPVFIHLSAQTIKGTILDSTSKKPLENVIVLLKRTSEGSTSDSKGRFIIESKRRIKPQDSVLFSLLGYKPITLTIDRLIAKDYTILLSESKEILDEVNLNLKKRLRRRLSFKELAEMPIGLYDFGSDVVDGKIYAVCGNASTIDGNAQAALETSLSFGDYLRQLRPDFSRKRYSDKLLVYDIEQNDWEVSSIVFRKRAFHNVLNIEGQIFSFGGKRISLNGIKEYLDDKIEILNLSNNQITIDDTNPHQAVNSAAINYNGNIILMGGSIKERSNGQKIYTKESHMFNSETGLWYKLKDMILDKEAKGILVEQTVYIIGGYRSKPLRQIESYDLKTGKWRSEGNLFFGIARPALTTFKDTIFIFDNGSIIVYDTKTKILKEYLVKLPIRSSSMHYHDNKLIIIGGYIEDNFSIIPSKKVYSIDLGQFEKTRVYQSKSLEE